RAAHPDMHVYHYAPHERSALSRLAMTHGVGEAEVDDWLRSGVLVDLYGVVRQGLQVGEESYSLKRLEHHHGFRRLEESVRAGGGAIATFEAWRECGAQELLDAIRDYNREDCESTRSLAAWLWEHMRPEAEAQFGVDFGALMAEVPEAHDPPPWLGEVEALRERLHAGLPDEPADDHLDEAERRLLGHLILYHHRENKPQWWDYFRMAGLSAEELADEREAIGLIALDESVAPTPYKRSLDWTLRFPPQETKLGAGPARDPIAGDNHTIVSVDEGTLVLRRGKGKDAPRPTALMGGTPPDPKALRGALVELAGEVADAAGAAGRFPALRALLRGDPPALDPSLLRPEVDSLVVATLALSGTTLPVQGPPGTGKTYSGARMIVAALAAGRRVAITANSHAAIQNLLRAVEEHAAEVGAPFAGAYRGEGYDGSAGYIEELGNEEIEAGDHQLVAGTAWLLSREAFRAEGPRFDLLFVDEAGQMALAAALAAGTCADSLVLLGDPQQLPQVNQAAHPEGAGASVLEHVLAGHDTLPSDRGVLLDVSWRMHPEVCAFVSERSYGGLLASRPECAVRSVDAPGPLAGAGLRTIEVDHAGRSQESAEEAQAVARACADLLAGGTVTDRDGSRRPLTAEGIMVVAPFNMAVACIRRAVPEGVRVGTVDRFQGQEAPVVFFAMTCSSGEDVPRGLEFLFERNRLNVAISRAQCLAVLVHSPRLLDADCRSLEQMALVDGACRFVEMAAGQAGVITPA
ncbi:MAG: AAA domain-containing protein, partial [Miltoncostaeaceae bacterium]